MYRSEIKDISKHQEENLRRAIGDELYEWLKSLKEEDEMKVSITKIFTFDAAHMLPFHKGKCKNLHGHTYKLAVTISGLIQTEGEEKGMVIDFGTIKTLVEEHVLKFDHSYLNDFFGNPTVEHIASHIFIVLNSLMPVEKVRLWETPDSYAEVTA